MNKIVTIFILLLLIIGIGLIVYQYRGLLSLGWNLITGQSIFNFETPQNPLEKLPTLNPIEKANPFKNSYKNPFE